MQCIIIHYDHSTLALAVAAAEAVCVYYFPRLRETVINPNQTVTPRDNVDPLHMDALRVQYIFDNAKLYCSIFLRYSVVDTLRSFKRFGC